MGLPFSAHARAGLTFRWRMCTNLTGFALLCAQYAKSQSKIKEDDDDDEEQLFKIFPGEIMTCCYCRVYGHKKRT